MQKLENQISLPGLIVNHFYVGFLITAFYIWLSPKVIQEGYPGLAVLLLAEVFILFPVVGGHMLWKSRTPEGKYSFRRLIPFREKLSLKKFLLWMLAGMVVSALIYVPLYPMGLHLRTTLFGWLPEWYFNPTFGTDDLELIARVFLIGVFIDGFVGPIIEELFFRGYLLPRMAYLKNWAPILNGVMFGAYHFWQPHNLIAVCSMGVILSLIVWKTRNVYLGIAIHCTLNILGALSGFYAVSNGILVGR